MFNSINTMTPFSGHRLCSTQVTEQQLVSSEQHTALLQNMAMVQAITHQPLHQEIQRSSQALQNLRKEMLSTQQALQEENSELRKQVVALQMQLTESKRSHEAETLSLQQLVRSLQATLKNTQEELTKEREQAKLHNKTLDLIKERCLYIRSVYRRGSLYARCTAHDALLQTCEDQLRNFHKL